MSKTPDPKLFDLIHSLTATEKRYFKVNVGKSSGKNNHQFMEIFEIISKMKSFDEEELKAKLDKGSGSKHLAFRKSHLYNVILSELRGYHKTSSQEIEVLNLLQSVKITFDKGLFHQSETLIKKLKKKCVDYNFKQYIIAVGFWEKKIINSLTSGKFKESSNHETEKKLIDKLVIEQKDALGYLNKELHLWLTRVELLDFYRFGKNTSKHTLTELKAKSKSILLSKPSNDNHIELKVQELIINHMIIFFEGDYNRGYKLQYQLLNLLKDNPKYIETNLDGYITQINNFLTISFNAGIIDEVPKWLEELDAQYEKPKVKSNLYLGSRVYSFHQLNQLRYFNYQEMYPEACAALNTKRYSMYDKEINPYKRFQIIYNLVISLFFCSNYKATLQWANRIINSSIKVRPKELSLMRTISYLVHYKLGNHSLIESLHASINQKFNTDLELNVPEKIVLDSLNKMCFNPLDVKNLKIKLHQDYDDSVQNKNTTHKNMLNFIGNSLIN